MVQKLDERIAGLEERLKQLRTQQSRVRARALASRRARKNDTRCKILIGAVVLAKVDQGVLQSVLRTWLDAALTQADDRELFNLPVGSG